jgi:hypothetical protein
MSKNQFEQLIEYVINDEDAKAKELFHQIVVSKSRQIYENLMAEDNNYGTGMNAMGVTSGQSNEMDEGDDMMMGGSATEELMQGIQAEENGDGGMMEADDEDAEFDDEAEEAGDDLTKDMEDDNDMEMDDEEQTDRILDLEDKLDELMAQFEEMMGDNDMGDMDDMDDMGMDGGMSDMGMDDDEFETEGMMENITLKAAPKPVTSEPAGTNTKSITAFNSGATGMAAHPVKMTGDTAKGRPNPTAKDMIGNVGNTPAQGNQTLKPATKPHLGQAAGVNTRTPFPKGK